MSSFCQRLTLLGLWLFVGAGAAVAQGDAPATMAMPPREKILDCVKRFTGLEAHFTVEKTEQVSLSEIRKTYFWAPIKEKMGIRVSFAPGKIAWDLRAGGKPDPYLRRFAVYLDAEANHVLAVISRLAEKPPDGSPPCPPETFQPEAMDQISDSLPATDPKFTFADTLNVSGEKGLGNPRMAQEIDAFYVLYARNMGPGPAPRLSQPIGAPTPPPEVQKPHPAWIILMRGQPPFPAPMPYFPNAPKIKAHSGLGQSSAQHFVDAFTGRPMGSYINTTGGF
jgi:hypothetical protein